MMKRALALGAVALLLIGTPALAQGGGARGERGQQGRGAQQARMTAEQSEAAWKLQATSVAHQAGADEDATKKLIDAYTEARKGLNEKMREARGEGGRGGAGGGDRGGAGGRGGRGANPEMLQEARAGLAAKVTEILGEEKGEKAMAALGTFSAEWDRMVHTVAGFELEGDSRKGALGAIQKYIVGSAELRNSEDRQNMREGMMELRENLNESLGEVLTEEQMESFTQANRAFGGRGGRGGGGGDGGRGGGGGDDDDRR